MYRINPFLLHYLELYNRRLLAPAFVIGATCLPTLCYTLASDSSPFLLKLYTILTTTLLVALLIGRHLFNQLATSEDITYALQYPDTQHKALGKRLSRTPLTRGQLFLYTKHLAHLRKRLITQSRQHQTHYQAMYKAQVDAFRDDSPQATV